MLTIFLVQMTIFAAPFATETKEEKDAEQASKIKSEVMRLGLQARVKIKLKNNAKFEGFVSRIESEHFVVTNGKNKEEKTIAYREVKKVKKNNLSTAAKIGIGAAITVAVVGLIAVITGRSNENKGKPCPLIFPERCP